MPRGVVGEPRVVYNLALSPDERQVAAAQFTQQPGGQPQFDIWLIDLSRAGAGTRLTDDPAWEFDPAWSPGGDRVVFNSNRPEPGKSAYNLFVRASDGSGKDELLVKSEESAGHAGLVARRSLPRGTWEVMEICGRSKSMPQNRRSFWPRRTPSAARPSHPMASGSRTSRTRRDAGKCTFCRFLEKEDQFPSRVTEGGRRSGAATVGNSSSCRSTSSMMSAGIERRRVVSLLCLRSGSSRPNSGHEKRQILRHDKGCPALSDSCTDTRRPNHRGVELASTRQASRHGHGSSQSTSRHGELVARCPAARACERRRREPRPAPPLPGGRRMAASPTRRGSVLQHWRQRRAG